MQIISGSLKGKKIINLSNLTHPMSEKIRGGLFNILGDVEGLTVLDCYAGTGAIAFEAISRGAMSAVLVESDNKAQQSIISNIKSLGLESKTKLFKTSVKSFSNSYLGAFDLVICDSPYDQPINEDVIAKLEKFVKSGGLVIVSSPVGSVDIHFEKLSLIKEKTYTDARLVFFR
jgi:16S rRNA (guanine966-N2)-methyltransferase